MRIVATSDFHGTLPAVPECDLLLIGGDICPVWNHDRKFQANWLGGEFTEWLEEQPAQVIVGVAGNHDFVLQENPNLGYELPWSYLCNEARTVSITEQLAVRDVKIWGSPYSNKFGSWAFMQKEPELAKIWDEIPRDTEIIIVHGPPYGFGDEVPGKVWQGTKWTNEHVGSTSLANQLYYDVWPNLKLVVFGHIHEGYGVYSMKHVRMVNVSHMNDEYEPVNPPMVIEL